MKFNKLNKFIGTFYPGKDYHESFQKVLKFHKTKSLNGFTLAETLIALVILGVVATISISHLVNRVVEKQTITKLKKTYAELQNAYDIAVVKYGPVDTWIDFANDSSSAANGNRNLKYFKLLIRENFNYVKECGFSDDGCFAINQCKGLNGNNLSSNDDFDPCTSGTNIWTNKSTWRRILKKDGIAIGIRGLRGTPNWNSRIYNVGATIHTFIAVDVNGTKAPNTLGKDIFVFAVTDKGIYPVGGTNYVSGAYKYPEGYNCSMTTSGFGCTFYALKNGNMSYLRGKY